MFTITYPVAHPARNFCSFFPCHLFRLQENFFSLWRFLELMMPAVLCWPGYHPRFLECLPFFSGSPGKMDAYKGAKKQKQASHWHEIYKETGSYAEHLSGSDRCNMNPPLVSPASRATTSQFFLFTKTKKMCRVWGIEERKGRHTSLFLSAREKMLYFTIFLFGRINLN